MEIFNIGPLELIIIVVLMFILLGPKDMILTAQRIGRWVRNFVRSPMWREIWGYSQEIRELPQKIMDESGLEETLAEVKKSTREATDEINAQMKEVGEAARVPEAEHVRLDTAVPAVEDQTIKSPETGLADIGAVVPTVEPETPGLAQAANAFLAEAAGAMPPDMASQSPIESEQPAMLNTAETAGTPVQEVEPVSEGFPTTEPEAVKKPRRKKAAVESAEGEEPAPAPRRTRARKTAVVSTDIDDQEAGAAQPKNGASAEIAVDAPEAAPEVKPVRRTRKPRASLAENQENTGEAGNGTDNGRALSTGESPAIPGNGISSSAEENISSSGDVVRTNPGE